MNKILIIKPCALGDMILCLPTVRAIKRQYPQAQIDFLTNEIGAIAAEGDPYIDRVLLLTKQDGADSMGKVRGVRSWYHLWRRLRSERYDMALSLRYTGRNNIMTGISGAPIRIGYAMDGTEHLLTHSRPNLTRLEELPEIEYAMKLLPLMGIDSHDTALEFFIKPEAKAFVDSLITVNGRKKIALNVYSAKGYHRSLKEETIKRLVKQANLLGDVYFIGSAAEADYLETLIVQQQLPAQNMAGKLTFMESAALLARMDLFVSADGGALHLGRAVGIPVIALMGDSSAGQWGTKELHNTTLSSRLSCAPCRITKAQCVDPTVCIDHLIDEQFFSLLEQTLTRKKETYADQ